MVLQTRYAAKIKSFSRNEGDQTFEFVVDYNDVVSGTILAGRKLDIQWSEFTGDGVEDAVMIQNAMQAQGFNLLTAANAKTRTDAELQTVEGNLALEVDQEKVIHEEEPPLIIG